ncbi:winged helix-turn-helix domain-containing protein [Falsihalocynthiibacter sp. BN13B15]|uniref:winged helix-turn-helix domain-containing protein n=1 Tax=Falsihalocynthiibacter sp. BN13B15 TaxID=3240871 RepID=UPI00350EDB66
MSGNPNEKEPKYSEIAIIGDFRFDVRSLTLFDIEWQPVSLRHQSALVLCELAKSPSKTVSKDRLVSAVWGGTFVSDDSLVQCIKDIRKALCDNDRKLVRTVARIGYRLDTYQPVPSFTTNQKPSIFIENIQSSGNRKISKVFATNLRDKLVLVMAPRTEVRVFTSTGNQTATDYIVQGRANVSGDCVKLFLSLSEVTLHGHFYAESFERDVSEIDQLAEDVARKISSVLRISVFNHDGEKYGNKPDGQLDFQQLMAKAHYFYGRITVPATAIARTTLQVAVERSPDDPKALAMLAHSTTQMRPYIRIEDNEAETIWALSLADRAVALGATSAFAFRTRANLRLWLLGDHKGCRTDCVRALAINPNFYLTHLTLATSEILTGAHIAGIDRIRSFVSLTKIDRQYAYFQSLIGLAWILAGDDVAAIQFASDAYERLPDSSWHAMVYAAAASVNSSITKTEEFKKMIYGIDLPFTHFRSLPFADVKDVEMLESRLRAVGLGAEQTNLT